MLLVDAFATTEPPCFGLTNKTSSNELDVRNMLDTYLQLKRAKPLFTFLSRENIIWLKRPDHYFHLTADRNQLKAGYPVC